MLGGFLVGLIVGCFVGVFTACLLVAARCNSAHLSIPESIEVADRRGPGSHSHSHRRRGEQSVYFAVSKKPIEAKLRSHLRDVLREATTNISGILLGVWVGPFHHPEVEDRVKLGNLVPGALIEMMDGVPFYLDPNLPEDRIRVVIAVRKKRILSQGDTPPEKVTLEAEMA